MRKAKSIGGRVSEHLHTLKNDIEYINAYLMPLFADLQMVDIDLIVDALGSNFSELKNLFLDHARSGKVDISVYVSRDLQRELVTMSPEEQAESRRVKRNLSNAYRSVCQKHHAAALCRTDYRQISNRLRICRAALYLAEDNIKIDEGQFLEIYRRQSELESSITHEKHESAAHAVNEFFNGLELTERELWRYFRIEHGTMVINPHSVNANDYARLGFRHIRKRS